MNIYHLQRTARAPWTREYTGFVVIAPSPERALALVADRHAFGTTFSATEIGVSHSDREDVVLSDQDDEY